MMPTIDPGIDLSQDEIHAINVFTALKSSLKHRCKHILRSLGLYGDQAYALRSQAATYNCFTKSLQLLQNVDPCSTLCNRCKPKTTAHRIQNLLILFPEWASEVSQFT